MSNLHLSDCQRFIGMNMNIFNAIFMLCSRDVKRIADINWTDLSFIFWLVRPIGHLSFVSQTF